MLVKGGDGYENREKVVTRLAKASAEKALRRDANRTTCAWLYQPKAPVGLDRFRKPKA